MRDFCAHSCIDEDIEAQERSGNLPKVTGLGSSRTTGTGKRGREHSRWSEQHQPWSRSLAGPATLREGEAHGPGDPEPEGNRQWQPAKACLFPVCSHRCLPVASKPVWLLGPEQAPPNPAPCSMLIPPTSVHGQPEEPLENMNHLLSACSQCSSGFPSYQAHGGPSDDIE